MAAGSEDFDTGISYADMWDKLTMLTSDKERGAFLRERVLQGKKIYAWAGHKDGDKERLIAAIGKPGCTVTRLEDIPLRVNGIYLLADLMPLLNAAEAEANWRAVIEEELDRLAAMGRAEWAVLADHALVAA